MDPSSSSTFLSVEIAAILSGAFYGVLMATLMLDRPFTLRQRLIEPILSWFFMGQLFAWVVFALAWTPTSQTTGPALQILWNAVAVVVPPMIALSIFLLAARKYWPEFRFLPRLMQNGVKLVVVAVVSLSWSYLAFGFSLFPASQVVLISAQGFEPTMRFSRAVGYRKGFSLETPVGEVDSVGTVLTAIPTVNESPYLETILRWLPRKNREPQHLISAELIAPDFQIKAVDTSPLDLSQPPTHVEPSLLAVPDFSTIRIENLSERIGKPIYFTSPVHGGDKGLRSDRIGGWIIQPQHEGHHELYLRVWVKNMRSFTGIRRAGETTPRQDGNNLVLTEERFTLNVTGTHVPFLDRIVQVVTILSGLLGIIGIVVGYLRTRQSAGHRLLASDIN